MSSDPYSDFKAYLKRRGWSHLGTEALALKLKIGVGIADSILKGKPLQQRSKYLLWRATNKKIESLEPKNLPPLVEWLYENNYTSSKLSEATGINASTVEGYIYKDATPSPENTVKLYALTKLEIFAPEQDAIEATRRVLTERLTIKESQNEAPDKKSTLPTESPSYLYGLFNELSQVLTVEAVFGVLTERLEVLLTAGPVERAKLIQRIGPKRFGYWVSFFSALQDEDQFKLWLGLTDHTLKEMR